MFLENSRYHKQSAVEVTTRDGHTVQALKLRKLPAPPAQPHSVQQHDRLDILAHQHYGDGTKFWHIADANTELQANDLVAEPGTTIDVPET
jgi:nucleoid-associated protein YgaU